MAVGLCALVFALAVGGVAAWRDHLGVGHSLRESVVVAAALVGGFVVAITEGLGAVGELHFVPIIGCWLGAALALAALLVVKHRELAECWKPMARFEWSERVLIALFGAVVGAAGLLAVLCPPNNFDVVLYHLPRQLQWLQQGSVAHFPTQDYRLTVNPPFAEFVGLHLMLLSGTDRLATVESWSAMVLTLAAVSLVGRELGLSRKGQLLTALFAATVPIGFHEAANGKNDWLVGFWLAATTYWGLKVWKSERIPFAQSICAGLSLGLLVLTKGTGGVYAVPLVLLGGLGLAVRRPRGWMPALLTVATLAVLPNVGHWSRNFIAYGSVNGKTFGLDNERHSPAVWTSGLVRNLGMHLASPRGAWNRKVDKYVHRVHDWLGLGVEDPQTTWLGIPFKVEYHPQQEDFATAPAHAILLVVSLIALVPLALRRRDWFVYWLVTAGGGLLFCVVFKWQPWHPRLHLPCLALGGVAFGWLATQTRMRWLTPLAVAGLVLSVVPVATRSEARSLGPDGLNVFTTDPDRLRFFNRDTLLNDAREVVMRVKAKRPLAVDLINQEPSPWEYPIALWLREGADPPRIGYFYPVAGLPTAQPLADMVIDVASEHPPEWIRHPQTRIVYRIAERVGRFTIYSPLLAGVDPPTECDQPVSRFGIGTEPPASR